MRLNRIWTPVFVTALCALSSCKPAGVDQLSMGSKKPAVSSSAEIPVTGDGTGSGGESVVKDDRVIDAVMRVKAKALFLTPCSGDLGVRIRLKLDDKDTKKRILEVPVDTVKCIIYGDIGLKKMLEGDDDAAAAKKCKEQPAVEKAIYEEDGVLHFKQLLARSYEPGRPFLPSFISAKPEVLRNINATQYVTLTDHCADDKQASGTITSKTVAFKESVSNKPFDREFKNVYDFEFTNEGFDGVDRIGAFLFDRMKIQVSLEPFAILNLELDTSVSKLLGAEDGLIGAIGSLITVRLTGEVIEMKGLPPKGQSTDDGVVTGAPDD